MMDDITWIHVASDAVKIGLGAVIGGLSALLIAYQSHRHTKDQEYATRRRDLLEKISPKFDEVSLGAMSQAVTFVRAVTQESGVEAEIDKARFSFDDRAEKILQLNKELNLVESNVALLGYKDLADDVETFRSKFRDLVGSERAERARSVQVCEELSELRYQIIEKFAEAYRLA